MSTIATAGKGDFKPALWTPGDWNAFFGFGTNILVNMLVLTGLLRFVLKMPDSLVFGRILPALGLMMCLSTMYYAWLAYRLAQKTGRNDVCALPSGVSVPHMFIVTFVIMLPITLKTGDPVKGWSAGLVWVFFQSFILMIGGFIAPYIRKITPRAALLGTLAGVSVTFISMRPALEMFMTPQIGLVCFAIILASWFGGVKYPKGIPAGLVAIAAGMLIAWGSNLFGLGLGGLSLKGLGDAFANFGFSVPIPAIGQVFSGFEFLGIILVTAIPFGIYDLVEAMDNVESAEAAGDEYPTTRVLTADGVVSLIGCLMGNPFINAVYIGHPGWKAMGGRIGYSAATGIMVVLLSWFGIISVLLALVPVVAISPILLYIGMLIGAQAFQTTPVKHAPAVVLAFTPHLAAWAKLQIDTMLGSTLSAAQKVGGMAADKAGEVKAAAIAALPQQGVLYHGLEVMGGGSILTGLVLGAIGVFVIERDFVKAAAFALAGAVLTYFGFMHGEAVGIGGGLGVTPAVALAYAVVAALFMGLAKSETVSVSRSRCAGRRARGIGSEPAAAGVQSPAGVLVENCGKISATMGPSVRQEWQPLMKNGGSFCSRWLSMESPPSGDLPYDMVWNSVVTAGPNSSDRWVQVSSRPILRRTSSPQPLPICSPTRRCKMPSTSMQVGKGVACIVVSASTDGQLIVHRKPQADVVHGFAGWNFAAELVALHERFVSTSLASTSQSPSSRRKPVHSTERRCIRRRAFALPPLSGVCMEKCSACGFVTAIPSGGGRGCQLPDGEGPSADPDHHLPKR